MQEQELRAVIWPLLNPDDGMMRNCRVRWDEIAPTQGTYEWSVLQKALEETTAVGRCMLLTVEPNVPDWCTDAKKGFMELIEALGTAYGKTPVIFGVNVTLPDRGMTKEEALACYGKAFPHAYLFVQPGFAENRNEYRIGYSVNADNCAAFSERSREYPLKMRLEDVEMIGADAAAACGISVAETEDPAKFNRPSPFGHRFRVEKLRMEPQPGGLTVRALLTNGGSAPCYSDSSFLVRLNGSDVPDARVTDLGVSGREIMPGGSREASCVIDTRGLTPGEYDVHIGLRLEKTGYPVSFGIEGRISDGFYEGRMIYVHSETGNDP